MSMYDQRISSPPVHGRCPGVGGQALGIFSVLSSRFGEREHKNRPQHSPTSHSASQTRLSSDITPGGKRTASVVGQNTATCCFSAAGGGSVVHPFAAHQKNNSATCCSSKKQQQIIDNQQTKNGTKNGRRQRNKGKTKKKQEQLPKPIRTTTATAIVMATTTGLEQPPTHTVVPRAVQAGCRRPPPTPAPPTSTPRAKDHHLQQVASQPRLVSFDEVGQHVSLRADEEALLHEAGVHDQAPLPLPVDQHLRTHVRVPPTRYTLPRFARELVGRKRRASGGEAGWREMRKAGRNSSGGGGEAGA